MSLPTGPVSDRVLLVEGRDDRHVVEHICRRCDLEPTFQILEKGGFDALVDSIGAELKVPARRAVGILVDADDGIDARWAAVSDRLGRAGLDVRERDPTGTVIRGTSPDPDIGIWIMPDNQSPGELEDFIEAMIPLNDPIWPLSTSYIDGISAEDRLFSTKKTLRAQVHAWLAARERPRPMGLAIGARDLDVEGVGCAELTTWLRRLFG